MLMNRTTPFMVPVDDANPAIIKDEALCSECGHCFAVCEEEIGVAAKYLLNQREAYQCIGCGQCSASCPEKAITGRPHYKIVKELIQDPEKIVVFSTSPSVRVGFADGFGKEPGTFAQDEMVGALRALGADYVFDVTFSADLTIMEESKEFLERVKSGEKLPLFTSCCPAWVKFCEQKYPELRENISTCRSPQQMFGAVLKEEARNNKEDSRKTIVVSIMPCTAKKAEILRPEHKTEGEQDVDFVLTTTEIIRMIKEAGIDLTQMPWEAMDMPFGLSSGAGVIFGVTGGVTEAVLRRLVADSGMEALNEIKFTGIRGTKGIKEAVIPYGDRQLKIAVVSGLKNADELIQKIKSGEVQYDFVEVMACRRGCMAGGGQPVPIGPRTKAARFEGLYRIDDAAQIKRSNDNPIVGELYEGLLKGKEHKLLHNNTDL